MKIIGIMPVRNEQWCLGLTLRAALMWCDEIVVLDHASTDYSSEIIAAVGYHVGHRMRWLTEPVAEWREMAHRQRMLERSRQSDATHIVMIDADEVLTGNLLSDAPNGACCIKGLIENIPQGTTLQLPWLALPRTTGRYLTSGIWGPGQQVSMAFKDEPAAHWATVNGYDFHHRNPMGLPIGRFSSPLKPEQGGIMHLQFLSQRRLRAKQALYQLTEVLRWPGRLSPAKLARMYGRAVYESDPTKHRSVECPAEWWAPYERLMQYLDLDESKVPWQETEVHRIIAEHGREKFTGLDLFGIA